MEEKKVEKLSYEQLENVAHQLSEQCKTLYTQLKEVNMQNAFKRLDYLFKVVEFKPSFDNNFVEQCVAEIKSIITIPEEEETTTSK